MALILFPCGFWVQQRPCLECVWRSLAAGAASFCATQEQSLFFPDLLAPCSPHQHSLSFSAPLKGAVQVSRWKAFVFLLSIFFLVWSKVHESYPTPLKLRLSKLKSHRITVFFILILQCHLFFDAKQRISTWINGGVEEKTLGVNITL